MYIVIVSIVIFHNITVLIVVFVSNLMLNLIYMFLLLNFFE